MRTTRLNNPNRQGVVRTMARVLHCRCVSRPRWARTSQKGDLDVPAANVPGNELQHGNRGVGAKQGKGRALATGITQEDPADGQWILPIAMPQGCASHQIHLQLLSSIPADIWR